MGKIELTRRKFIIGASTSLIAAPAIVRIASLMPVRVHDYWDIDRWYHIVAHVPVEGKLRYYIDGALVDNVRISKGINRFAEKFIPPTLDGDSDYFRIADGANFKKPYTFEAQVKDAGKIGEYMDNIRITKGDRYE